MYKRIFAMVMSICLLVTLCAGCRDAKEETSILSYYEGEDVAGEDSGTSDKTSGAAGGQSQGSSKTQSTASTGNSKIKNPLAVDLKGAQISIYSTAGTFNPDPNESKAASAQAAMLESLQQKINCKIVYKGVADTNLKSFAVTAAASGKALCNIIEAPIYSAGSYVIGDLVTNLKTVSTMDLTQKYLSYGDIINASSIGSGTYACASRYNFFGYYATGIYFNKRILGEIGHDNNYIYNLVNNGKWMIAEYRKLATAATKDLDGKTGMTENDQWGQIVVDAPSLGSYNVLEAFDAKMLKRDSAGKLVYNMEDPKIMTALDSVYDTFVGDASAYNGSKTDSDLINLFSTGKSLFFYSPMSNVMKFTGMSDDYGFVPTPKASASSNYASAINWNASVFMLPKGQTATELSNSGAFLQALCYMEENVVKKAISEYSNRYFVDEESSKSVDKILSTQNVTVSQMFSQVDQTLLFGTAGIPWEIFNTNKRLTASSIQANKQAVIAVLNDINSKLK